MVKNSLTENAYVTSNDKFDFETERSKALNLVHAFYENGPKKCTMYSHSYFGKLTPDEWAILKWKHYDHHLRQFGV